MTTGTTNNDISQAIKFIRDEAAEEDFFGAHSQVGRAIADTILTNPDMKIIGLLGPWGSGKSTAVKQVEIHLQKDKTVQTHVFIYDAWLHQSEPPRRSFLEAFLKFLTAKDLTQESSWEGEIKRVLGLIDEKITTTTPTMTFWGKLLLVSLLLFPIGLKFLDKDFFSDVSNAWKLPAEHSVAIFTAFCLLAPALVAVVTYLFWRPTYAIFSYSFWSSNNWFTHRAPHSKESIISVFINKSVARQESTTIKSVDPTAIEFQQLFAKISNSLNKSTRLILVIDNLDRLPAAEAVAMWTTIRSFFLGADGRHETGTTLPVILLPIDEKSIEIMFKKDEETVESVVRSFMEKTFDLTFRVTPPVMSDWKAYLDSRMKMVFGEKISDDHLFQAKFIVEKRIGEDWSVTPRGLNVLVNSIATIWLQRRHDGISFAATIYFATFKDSFYRSNSTPNFLSIGVDISDFDSEWQSGLAALYYGVSPDKALQVLIEEKLRGAVHANSKDTFLQINKTPGFDSVFTKFIENIQNSPELIKVIGILSDIDTAKSPWIAHSQQILRKKFSTVPDLSFSSEEAVAATIYLIKDGPSPSTQKFAAAIIGRLQALGNPHSSNPPPINLAAKIILELINISQKYNFLLPKLNLGQNFRGYLRLCLSLPRAEAMKMISINISIIDVARALILEFDDSTDPELEDRLKFAFEIHPDGPWEPIVDHASHIVRTRDGTNFAIPAALYTLGKFAPNLPMAKTRIEELFRENSLQRRMAENTYHADLIWSRGAALMLIYEPTQVGSFSWDQAFMGNPGLPQQIMNAAVDFGSIVSIDALIIAVDHRPDFTLITERLGNIMLQSAAIYIENIDFIIDRISAIIGSIFPDTPIEGIVEIGKHTEFWRKFGERSFDQQTRQIFEVFMTRPADDVPAEFVKSMRQKLSRLTVDDWQREIISSENALPYAEQLYALSNEPINSDYDAMADALDLQIDRIVNESDKEIIRCWFRIAALLSPAARRGRYANLRDKMLAQTPGSQNLILTLGGNNFLQEGEFESKADECTRIFIHPQFNSIDDAKTLLPAIHIFGSWVTQSKKSTQTALVDHIIDLAKIATKEERKELFEIQGKLLVGVPTSIRKQIPPFGEPE